MTFSSAERSNARTGYHLIGEIQKNVVYYCCHGQVCKGADRPLPSCPQARNSRSGGQSGRRHRRLHHTLKDARRISHCAAPASETGTPRSFPERSKSGWETALMKARWENSRQAVLLISIPICITIQWPAAKSWCRSTECLRCSSTTSS